MGEAVVEVPRLLLGLVAQDLLLVAGLLEVLVVLHHLLREVEEEERQACMELEGQAATVDLMVPTLRLLPMAQEVVDLED